MNLSKMEIKGIICYFSVVVYRHASTRLCHVERNAATGALPISLLASRFLCVSFLVSLSVSVCCSQPLSVSPFRGLRAVAVKPFQPPLMRGHCSWGDTPDGTVGDPPPT